MLFEKGVFRILASSYLYFQVSESLDNLHQENRFHSKKEEVVAQIWPFRDSARTQSYNYLRRKTEILGRNYSNFALSLSFVESSKLKKFHEYWQDK